MNNSTKKISHVLLADDDEDDRMMFSEAIKAISTDIKVTLAENEPSLLMFLDTEIIPDVIFLDVNMPVKSGLECLRVIKNNINYINSCVVMYSTSDYSRDVEMAYKEGADFYIIKPSNYNTLIEILRTLFDKVGSKMNFHSRETFLISDDRNRYLTS